MDSISIKNKQENPIRFVLLLLMVLISATSMKQLVHAVLNFSVINPAPALIPQTEISLYLKNMISD